MTQKQTRLSGGALTAEVIDSSKSVYAGGRSGTGVGLQQYFTPSEVGVLASQVLDPAQPTLDPTAGDGSLLEWVMTANRYGIEIDNDQIEAGNYRPRSINSDIQKAYPLLRSIGAKFPQVVCNPPFGLDWKVAGLNDGKKTSSTAIAFQMMMRLLDGNGGGIFICGRDRYNREVAPLPEARGVWAQIEVDDLFEGVTLPCVVSFVVGLDFAASVELSDVHKVKSTRAEMIGLGDALNEQAARLMNQRYRYRYTVGKDLPDQWQAAKAEAKRRKEAKKVDEGPDLRLTRNKIKVTLSEFAKVGLATSDDYQALSRVQGLDGLGASWAALNSKTWAKVLTFIEQGLLNADPALLEAVEVASRSVKVDMCPMYEVRPQQRLGYLDDLDNIVCRKDCPEKGYLAGETYAITTVSAVEEETEKRPKTNRNGDVEIREYMIKRRVLQVTIGKHQFNESTEDITFILDHFDVPDPGDLEDQFPEEVERARNILDDLTVQNNWPAKGLAWKDREGDNGERIPWQREDLARLVVKGRAVLAWEQGGGKSLGLMAAAQAAIDYHGLRKQCLMVVPQDLVDQWQREAEKFFGFQFEVIDGPVKAREVEQRMKRGEEGFFITWFEALSRTGSKKEDLDHRTFKAKKEIESSFGGKKKINVLLSTEENCPECTADEDQGWNGSTCETCGYVHRSLVVRPASHYLAGAFKQGVLCVDELSLIRGNSLRSKAVRGIRAACRFGGTGTPVANYISDAFWGLWAILGNASSRFPYAYKGGQSAFEDQFCVIELLKGKEEEGEQNQTKARKVLPQVTNVSALWRLLAAGMVRRRQEGMGDMVPRTDHKVEVPLGTLQAKGNAGWQAAFATWFKQQNPNHPLVEADVVEKFEATLGLLQKLEAMATMPITDKDRGYIEARYTESVPLSAYTPAIMKALELALKHVRAGEKVLIGSCRIDTGKFLADRLNERGVKAAHIVEPNADGRYSTKPPKKRAKEVKEFIDGDADVLCVGVDAMKMGHNLDTAACAIVLGLPWSHEADDQFIKRVHRLSSKSPVSIYRIVPTATIADRKYGLLNDKGAAADLALDGQLVDEPDKPVNWSKELKELRKAGLTVTEQDTVAESDLEDLWQKAEGIYEAVPPKPIAHVVSRPKDPERVVAVVEPKPPAAPFAFEVEAEEDESGQLGLFA